MRSRVVVLAGLVVAALLATACGARLDDTDVAAGPGAAGAAATGAPRATTPGADAPAPGAAGGPSSAAPASSPEGAAPSAGDATAPAGGAAACTPEPVDEVGVDDTSITLANVSTISGPIAGFGQTGVNAVKAYVAYANATGGVCGRELRLVTADDRLDAGVNRAETERLSREALGFVGAVTVVDDGGASVLEGTNIPDVGLTIGSARGRLATNFSPHPIDPNQPGNAAVAPLRHFAAQGVTSAAVVWPAQADARTRGQGYVHDLEQAGFTTIDTFEVAVTETNYVNVAQQIENAGIQLVVTTLEVTGMARLAQAFHQVGYRPQVPFYGAQAYGGQFLELAGPAAEGTTLAVTFSTFEDAAAVPAMATFLEWYERTAPGSSPDFFALMSWAATDMLVRALREAGGAPTRDAVLERLRAQTAYTGDGLLAPRNPPAKVLGDCFAVVRVEGGQWRRVEPESGFVNC